MSPVPYVQNTVLCNNPVAAGTVDGLLCEGERERRRKGRKKEEKRRTSPSSMAPSHDSQRKRETSTALGVASRFPPGRQPIVTARPHSPLGRERC